MRNVLTLSLILIIGIASALGQVSVVGEATIEWDDNSTNEEMFCIEYKPDGESWAVLDSVSANVTEYGPVSFAAPSTYSFRVVACNAAGSSDYTNQLDVSFQEPVPNAPTGLAASVVSASQINLSWNYTTDPSVTGFYIERKTGTGSFQRIATVGLVSSYPNTGLAYGTTYTYRVIAYNGTGESVASNDATATTSIPVPNAATNLAAAVVSSSQINLSWNYITDPAVTGFHIERKIGTGSFQRIATVGLVSSYSNTGLAYGTTYTYRIIAYNGSGEAAASNVATATTSIPVPDAPYDLATSVVSSSQINLTWSYSTDPEVTGFYIERKTGQDSFSRIATVDLVSSYSNTGVAYGTTYTYRVIAYNGTGSSGASNTATATTSVPAPSAPSELTATVASTSQIDLSWTYSSDPPVTGFYLDRKKAGGTYERVATLGLVTSYSDDKLKHSTQYTYQITAYNGSGSSSASNEATGTTFTPQKPNSPSIKKMRKVNDKNLELEWDEVTLATSYNIYRDTEAHFTPSASNLIAGSVNDVDPATAGVQWVDTDEVTGDVGTNYFYVVTALNEDIESDLSNRVGEFDFELITTPKTDFNEITLPFHLNLLTDAADLMNDIPNCNSVAYWDAAYQMYQQYISVAPATNFEISMGSPYYVNVTDDTIYTIMGELVECSYQLITTPKTDFNEVMLTLDKTELTMASELLEDIPNCNSVAYWHSGYQMYMQYIPNVPATDFEVKPGYPYYVNVTASGTWPEQQGAAKRMVAAKTLQEQTASSHSPHTVWGELDTEVNPEHLRISAYFATRPNEVLTLSSNACTFENGIWAVQCSAFPSAWQAGEVLYVVIENTETGAVSEQEIVLSYQPSDQAVTTSLSDVVQALPSAFGLSQNYPNPFNPSTTIPYQLAQDGQVRVTVYNVMGQEVATLIDAFQAAGTYEVIWDGRNNEGLPVSTSMYMVRMRAGEFVQTRKMTYSR